MSEPKVRIRGLCFEGCAHSEAALALVRRVAGTEAPHGTVVETIDVASQRDAVRLRFLGSPTVQVNGVDIDPDARERTDFAMACRLYGGSGLPSAELLVAAIGEAAMRRP